MHDLIAVLGAEAAAFTLDFHNHYLERSLERDMPSVSDIAYMLAKDDPQVIEPYPDDFPRPSCLVWGIIRERVGHIVIAWPPNPLVVTAYWPDTEPDEWTDDSYKRRVG